MTKRKFKLTEEERAQLFQAYELCKDGPTRTRYQAVKLYGEGYDVIRRQGARAAARFVHIEGGLGCFLDRHHQVVLGNPFQQGAHLLDVLIVGKHLGGISDARFALTDEWTGE